LSKEGYEGEGMVGKISSSAPDLVCSGMKKKIHQRK